MDKPKLGVWQPLPPSEQLRVWGRQSSPYIVTSETVAGRPLPADVRVCRFVPAPFQAELDALRKEIAKLKAEKRQAILLLREAGVPIEDIVVETMTVAEYEREYGEQL